MCGAMAAAAQVVPPCASMLKRTLDLLHAAVTSRRQVPSRGFFAGFPSLPLPLGARAAATAATAHVLDGRTAAAEWAASLAEQVPALTAALGRPPGLSVVLVGCRPDSELYVARKAEACARVGVACTVRRLPADVSQAGLRGAVAAAAADPRTDGVLLQLPLPRHLDEDDAVAALDPRKDVDGFHPENMGWVESGGTCMARTASVNRALHSNGLVLLTGFRIILANSSSSSSSVSRPELPHQSTQAYADEGACTPLCAGHTARRRGAAVTCARDACRPQCSHTWRQ